MKQRLSFLKERIILQVCIAREDIESAIRKIKPSIVLEELEEIKEWAKDRGITIDKNER